MAEKIISERVVSRRVIGSANPIAKKYRNLKGSISGVCVAPVLMIIALGMLFYGERFERSSKVVEALQLEEADSLTATSGMHKISGSPTVSTPVEAPQVGDTLYYSYTKQEYQEVEETEEETVTGVEEGMEYEEDLERVKLVEKWVDLESESKWAEFKLGKYSIKTSGSSLKLDLSSKEYREDNEVYYELTAGKTVTPEVGDYRLLVSYLKLDTDLIVVGEISNETISGGEVFIITNKSDSGLISDMKASETTLYWVLKVGSWILLTMGLLMILGPILSLLDFIPIAGQAANCAASIAAAVISALIVLAATLVIKFWYLCIALAIVGVIGLVVLLIVLISKKGKKGEEKEVKEAE